MHAQFLCPTDRRFLKRSSTERGSLGSQTPYRRHLPCGARRGARAGSRHCEFARPAQSVHALHTAVPTEPARSWSACSYRERSENRIVITPPHGRAPRLARPRAAPSSRLRASRNALPPWRSWPQASPAQIWGGGASEEVEGNFLNGTDRQPGCARGGGPRAVCRCAKRTSRQITCVLVSVFWVCSHVRQ